VSYYVAPSLEQLLAEVNARWPKRDKTSDGALGDAAHNARKSDHNPDYDDGGVIRARDFDEDLQGSTTPYPHFQTGRGADPLVQELLARCRSGAEKRVAYIIYEGKIYSATYGWVANDYSGVNAHGHHAHISIKHGDQYENDRSLWLPEEEDDMPLNETDKDFIRAVVDNRIDDIAKAVINTKLVDDPNDPNDDADGRLLVSAAVMLRRNLIALNELTTKVDMLINMSTEPPTP
jgi:hypothetical protein